MRAASLLAVVTSVATVGCYGLGPSAVPDAGLASRLVELVELTSAEGCGGPGVEVLSGFDENGDGELGPEEATSRSVLCGPQGGAPGDAGPAGADGDPGPPGHADPALLVRTVEVAAGELCPAGGVAVESGSDLDGDGVLEDPEVDSTLTEVICAGQDGDDGSGADPLLRWTPITADPACGGGDGVRVEGGLDEDEDGLLDDDEVNPSLTAVLCAGQDGTDGLPGDDGEDGTPGVPGTPGPAPVVRFTDEGPSVLCLEGGVRVEIGIDIDGSGELDDDEAVLGQSLLLCHAADGENGYGGGLAPPGSGSVLFGDVRVETSLDLELLQGIEEITGSLIVQGTLLPVVSLTALERVGGSLQIYANPYLTTVSFPALEDVDGQLRLQSDVQLELLELPSLVEVGGLTASYTALADLGGLTALRRVLGDLVVELSPLVDVDGIANLESVTGTLQFGYLSVAALPEFASLTTLGGLYLEEMSALTALTGFPLVTSVPGLVGLSRNSALATIDMLPAATLLGELEIYEHPALTELGGFDAVTTIATQLELTSLPALATLDGLTLLEEAGSIAVYDVGLVELSVPLVTSLGYFEVLYCEALATLSLPALVTVRDIQIGESPALSTLELDSLATVQRSLLLSDTSLTSLEGLPLLDQLGADLELVGNTVLTDVSALTSIRLLRGVLRVAQSPLLPYCALVEVAEALEVLGSVDFADADPDALYQGEAFDGEGCSAPCPGAAAGCHASARCWVKEGVDRCICPAGAVGDGLTCTTVDPAAVWGTPTRPTLDCADLRVKRPGAPDGTYTIRPRENENPFLVKCLQTVDDGGWTQLIAATLSADLGDGPFEYLFKSGSAVYISPVTEARWSWTSFTEVPGRYRAVGPGGSTFRCDGGEAGQWGIGCGQPGGPTVLPTGDPPSAALKDEAAATTTLCQAVPGLFGPGCIDDVEVYLRTATTPLTPPDIECSGGVCLDDERLCPSARGIDLGLVPSWPGTCDEAQGFVTLEGRCLFPIDETVGWRDARTTCRAAGGYLFLPRNEAEQTAANGSLSGSYHVGMCQHAGGRSYMPVGPGEMSYHAFPVSEPGTQLCAVKQNLGDWNDLPCTNPHRFLCAFDAPPPAPEEDRVLDMRPHGSSASGMTGVVQVPHHPTAVNRLMNGQAFTVEAWLYLRDLDEPFYLLDKRWYVYLDDGLLHFRRDGSGVLAHFTPIPIPLGGWFHFAMTYDLVAATVRAFIDGVEVASKDTLSPSAPVVDTAYDLVIGKRLSPGSPLGRADAMIDQWALWDRALTPAEVAALMPVRRDGTEDGLLTLFTFDDKSSSLELDRAGSGLHGRIGSAQRVPSTSPLAGLPLP